MRRQAAWRMLLTAAFLALMPWVAQAEIDPATAQKLLASNGDPDDKFGFSVSVDGDIAVIGAPGVYNPSEPEAFTLGSVYVFTRSCSNCTWEQQQQLFADDGDTGDGFGIDVSISGDTIVVGAPFDDTDNLDAGSAYIFTRSGSGEWTQQQKKLADRERRSVFGFSVAVDGDTLVIGARQNSQHGLYAGAAYVYTRLSNGVWGEPKKLMADESPTQDGREARFGASVDIDGDTIVIGAYLYNDGGLSDSGAAYVFTRSSSLSNDWDEHKQKLTAGDVAAGDQFGRSVSVSGDTVVIGSVQKDSGKGAAYVYTRSGSAWSQQQKLTADDGAAGDYFGISVAVQGDTAVIGAYGDDDKGDASGSAYIFTRTDSGWSQQQKLTAPDDGLSDYLGRAVDLSGDAIFVTAFNDDENGSGAGAAWAFSLVRLALREALAAVNEIDPSVFSNPNRQNALINQINEVISQVDKGTPASYADALDKLRNSIIRKTDGCAGGLGNNDWILDCTSQAKVYPLLQQAIVCVQRL